MIKTAIACSAATYAPIADEYYNTMQHPTCANFRWASDRLLDRHLTVPPPQGPLCDVGAGDSALAAWLARNRLPVRGAILVDASPEMLAHAHPWLREGARGVIAMARALPIPDRSLELVVASLADPFDDYSWWQEARRVLAANGRIVVTTPASGWAREFRESSDEPKDRARFVKSDGSTVDVPSHVRETTDERELISRAGLRVFVEDYVKCAELPRPISPKLDGLLPGAPVVVAYVVGH